MADCSKSCAITSRPYAGLPQNVKDDRERARELYKYFSPPKGSEPLDTVLTAHAQLAAWRLNAERAMISLIDEETQYFVAESTKTVHLDNAEKYDDPDDAIWAGCVSATKAGRLCEHTISTPPPPEGGVACFEVLDLSKDIRFNQLSFIAGPPNFRYYAGVPLRTNRGINIGSIYILDSNLRTALTASEKSFLGVMADNVIQHLEMTRDKKDRQRIFKMNECISTYAYPDLEKPSHTRRYSDHDESTDPDSDADPRRAADGTARIDVITRAAELLREAMDIEEGGGGVLFLDTSLATTLPRDINHTGDIAVAQGLEWQERSRSSRDDCKPAVSTGSNTRSSSPGRRNRNGVTETLAHTYHSVSTSPDQPEFEPCAPEELLELIKRYPRGRLFTFDQQGQELSDSSDSESLHNGRRKSKRQRQRSTADSATLRAHFPLARQIMFTPIWDSTTSRSAACFIYNCSDYRNFTHQLDFYHFTMFANCVDAELLRLANSKASEQKNDFIGSISHELRSPLHGILASCEFLQDTACTSFQQSLINTTESCARTLLDTVNMVLDYSKMNAFEKNKGSNGSSALADGTQAKRRDGLQADLSTHRNVDLAVLTEEVVEGVAIGHAFNDPQNQALHNETAGAVSDSRISSNSAPCRPDVELIVEIAKQDWTYWCEPGSIRRIVMNLAGNSLKYTQAGFVHIKLETEKAGDDGTEFGVLTVRDSGQGISPDYLRDHLFTPFVQESNQAPGIGLGLSLVKSILRTLGGNIHFESTVGSGTQATVKIPLTKRLASKAEADRVPKSNPPTLTNGLDNHKSDAQQSRSQSSGMSVAIHWPEDAHATDNKKEASRLLRGSVTDYLTTWCGTSISQWQRESSPDIVVVEESCLDALFRDSPQLSAPSCPTVVLALRGAGPVKEFRHGKNRRIEDVHYPIGPQKLARALQSCMERSRASIAEEVTVDSIAEKAIVEAKVDSITAAACDVGILSTEKEFVRTRNGVQDDVKRSTDTIDLTTTSAVISTALSAPEATRVLVVDDNAINLRLLQVGMKKRGYTSIVSASDGLEAVSTYRRLLAAAPPGIILMDLSMPVMDGFEATRQIRRIEAEYNTRLSLGQAPLHALIVALTGLASVTDQKKAYTSGVDAYVMKPVSFKKLAALLEGWMAARGVGVDVGVDVVATATVPVVVAS